MISYIFKNKTKNILMIVFTVLYIVTSNFFTGFLYSVTQQSSISFYEVAGVVAFALVLAYMFTLKRQYRLKEWLFPAAFAVLTVLSVYELVATVVYTLSTYDYLVLIEILSCISYAFAIIAYIFCFVGSIKNFKNVVFLKIGAILKIVGTVTTALVATIIEFISLGGMKYFENIDEPYKTYVYSSMVETAVKFIISLLFFVGILLLTLNKKSEYIDITPYVEERNAKKAAKRAARLEVKEQQEAEEQAPVPEVPNGCWRCMACGKILPDTQSRCECGYKK